MAANLFIGLNRGDTLNDIVSSGTTTGKEIEIAVDKTKVTYKNDLLVALENLEAFIVEQSYP